MKKLLLTTAAALAISSSAFADFGDQFYIRGDVSMSKFDKFKSDIGRHKTKFNSFGLDFGVGTYVADNMRAELVYNHVFATKAKLTVGKLSSKIKPSTQAVLLRGMFDVVEAGPGKVFVGAGVGVAKTSAKATITNTATNASVGVKAKAKNNFAYSAHVGYGFDLADGVKADVAYIFRDYGKTKNWGGVAAGGKSTLRSHNLSAGVRFDI